MDIAQTLATLQQFVPHIRNLDNRLSALLDQIAGLRKTAADLQAYAGQGSGITGPLGSLSDGLEKLENDLRQLGQDARGAQQVTMILHGICDEINGEEAK